MPLLSIFCLDIFKMRTLSRLNGWQRLWFVIASIALLYIIGWGAIESDRIRKEILQHICLAITLWLSAITLLYGYGAVTAWVLQEFRTNEQL
jgi:hypothetical protein